MKKMNEHSELLVQSLNKLDADIRGLRGEMQGLREDIKELDAFKWRIYGIASVLSVGLTLILNYIKGVK